MIAQERTRVNASFQHHPVLFWQDQKYTIILTHRAPAARTAPDNRVSARHVLAWLDFNGHLWRAKSQIL